MEFIGDRWGEDGALKAIRRALEQNHDNSALESDVHGVDFLRKSTLWRCGTGYIYRGFALAGKDG